MTRPPQVLVYRLSSTVLLVLVRARPDDSWVLAVPDETDYCNEPLGQSTDRQALTVRARAPDAARSRLLKYCTKPLA